MKYPAIIKKEKDGKYSVSFPDFKGGKFGLCVSCGDTLQEAEKNAEEALRLHVLGLIEDNKKLPKPTNIFEIEVEPFLDLYEEAYDLVETIQKYWSNMPNSLKKVSLSLKKEMENFVKKGDKIIYDCDS